MAIPKSCRWLTNRLLRWFHNNARDLPWRRTVDPYAIWISEVMLQQTQVATVVPYFDRFLKRFPTIRSLARASLQDVLRLWEGLGYYRRARDLHASARIIASEPGGKIPMDAAELARLPGFGRYMIGAVLSQAFDKPMPILEANSRRVLCRLFGLRGDPFRNPLQARLWRHAEILVPSKGAGQFNQAMMELGALVCKPERPGCALCPLAPRCVAHKRNLQHRIPQRRAAPNLIEVEEVAVVVRKRGRVLLVQRPHEGRWAGLWEFPHVEKAAQESVTEAAHRALRDLAGLEAELGGELLTLRHGITRFRIKLTCLIAEHRRGRFRSSFYAAARWVLPNELADYPVSSPQRQLARRLCLT